MRNVARLKMGYYPLPEAEGVKLRSLLSFVGPASVIDPCVGQGTALHLVASDAQARRYGVELDAERARIAVLRFNGQFRLEKLTVLERLDHPYLSYSVIRHLLAKVEVAESRTLASRTASAR